jgi:hypothetical protein
MIQFILYGSTAAFSALSFYEGAWPYLVFMVSQALTSIINRLEILKYVNIVLIVKRRYQYIKQLLSEATFTDDEFVSRCMNTGHILSQDSEKLFVSARYNVTKQRGPHVVIRIHDLQRIYSDLYDVLHTSSRSYGVLILLEIITVLTNAVPTIYLAVDFIKFGAFNSQSFNTWFKVITFLCSSSFGLLNFLWLTICCHTATDEVQDTLVCIQKLLLYPNGFSWSIADLKRLSSQLKNLKVEFGVCGFFTLNLQFICGTVGLLFSCILVMNQFSKLV